MPAVPWWAVLSSVATPVLLAIGWTVAAVRQPPGYDPIGDTISLLSSFGPVDRLIMIVCLAGLGLGHLVTAIGLRFVPLAGRLLYGCGGAATILVAAIPKVNSVTPPAHGIAAVVAFVALGAWPAATLLPIRAAPPRPANVRLPGRHRRDSSGLDLLVPDRVGDRPWVLRPPAALGASVTMLGFGLWLALQLPHGATAGLAERMTAGTQVLWPLIVVLVGLRWWRTRRQAAESA